MPSNQVTPKRIEFLRLLTRTGFASTRHLAESGLIERATEYSQSAFFKPLLEQLLVGRITVVSPYGIGKRVMYYLTKKGADLVAEADGIDPDSVRFVPLKGGIVKAADGGSAESLVRADFPHKEAYVSTLLALERYLENTDYQVENYRHYYDRKAGVPTFDLGGRRFRPDGLVTLRPAVSGSPEYSFVIELHRHSDRKKITAQLLRHVEAIRCGAMAPHFGKGRPHFVLSVYAAENVAVMRQVVESLKQDEAAWPYFEKFFLFAELTELRDDFYRACGYFGGTKKPLPPIIGREA